MMILIVDDSKSMRMIVLQALKLAGLGDYRTLEAENGREALRLVKAFHPDLVISDWQMPEMQGIDLLRRLRESGCTVLFGFITSESDSARREEALAAGASFVITKPLTSRSFERVLKPLLAEI